MTRERELELALFWLAAEVDGCFEGVESLDADDPLRRAYEHAMRVFDGDYSATPLIPELQESR